VSTQLLVPGAMTAVGGRALQEAIWRGSLPLEIRLAHADSRVYDKADPYLVHVPRISYLPFLLPRLHAFFQTFLIDPDVPLHASWFSFENVPLRWYHPVGLLYDLFSGLETGSKRDDRIEGAPGDDLPWKLVIHFSNYPYNQLAQMDAEGKAVHDAFINTVKEADFLRYGNAKGIMSLSKDDSTAFWKSVQDHNLSEYNRVNQRLMPLQGGQPLKHLPVRFYLPASPKAEEPANGHLKIVQSLIQPTSTGTGKAQTMGTALNSILPSLFPSKSTPILAKAILHGAAVPMSANLEELLRYCAYLDGWLHINIEMMG